MDKDVIKQVILEQESETNIPTLGTECEQLTCIDSLVSLPHQVMNIYQSLLK